MPKGFRSMTITRAEIGAVRGAAAFEAAALSDAVQPGFSSDELAARHHVRSLIRPLLDDGPALLGAEITSGEAVHDPPEPELLLESEADLPLTDTRLVRFRQARGRVPVFGSRVVVELAPDRSFVSASMHLAPIQHERQPAELSPQQALDRLQGLLGFDDRVWERIAPAEQIIVRNPRTEAWRLAWRFRNVPAAPPRTEAAIEAGEGLGCASSHHGIMPPDYDYFIDALDGSLAYFFSNTRHVDVPTWCLGEDEFGAVRTFYGRITPAGFELYNPYEDIATHDLGLQAIEVTPVPSSAVQNATSDWQSSNRAAVMAHVHTADVMDFLFGVLRRNSIDDQGMKLINVVNCSSHRAPSPPEWINAVWWKDIMWYGQSATGTGGYSSLARFLDVIAHELFHGVTEYTADLVYRDLPGALNESFSDIFGVIVANLTRGWTPVDPHWNWKIGDGLGRNGGPLRDMENPSSVGRWQRPDPTGGGWVWVTGYPSRMNDYVPLPYDEGGVHIFSSIHNKAAHSVLTARRGDGSLVLAPQEVAILYYLTLTKLAAMSDFSDARREMIAVANLVYGGNQARRTEVTQAIEDAYDAVGIV